MTTASLTSDPNVVLRRNGQGTNAFGLYVDYIVFDQKTGEMLRQERYFLAENILCKYVRQRGNGRAAWKGFPLPDHDEARKLMVRNIERYRKEDFGIQMVCEPVLVELAITDVESLRKQQPPGARYEGTRAAEKIAGKVDDEKWRADGF